MKKIRTRLAALLVVLSIAASTSAFTVYAEVDGESKTEETVTDNSEQSGKNDADETEKNDGDKDGSDSSDDKKDDASDKENQEDSKEDKENKEDKEESKNDSSDSDKDDGKKDESTDEDKKDDGEKDDDSQSKDDKKDDSSDKTTAADDIKYSGDAGDEIAFSGSDFSASYKKATGKELSYVKITTLPSSTYGTIYYSYGTSKEEKVKTSSKLSESNLSKTGFVAKKSGSVTIPIEMYGAGNDVTANILITVKKGASTANTISYTTSDDEAVRFKASDFKSVCEDLKDDDLDYVKFTLPSSSKGTLYYDYDGSSEAKVTSSKKYYTSGTPSLNKVYFVPKSGYSGTLTISYTGVTDSGDSFTGSVKIKADSDDDSDSDVPIIKYSVDSDDEVDFKLKDFKNACEDATDEDLIRIVFSALPSSSKGTLYLGYTSSKDYDDKVDKDESYYTDEDPEIGDITFVPKSSASGTVTITYKGYYTKTKYYTGKIQIKISGSDDDDDDDDDDTISTLTLSTNKNKAVTVNASSISTAYKKATKKTLSYVKFSSVSSKYGTLYYDYDGDDEAAVKNTQKYYSSKSPYIKNVSFVPAKNYTGTVTLSYTAYSTSGSGTSGKIKVTVKASSASSNDDEGSTDVSLGVVKNKSVTLTVSPFNVASLSATDESIAAVRIGLVNSTYGKLYYNYGKAGEYEIKTSTLFYTSREPYITGVTFVPTKGYKGNVSIGYTGTNTEGETFTGKILLTVASYKKLFTDVSENEWYYDTINTVCDAELMKGISETLFDPNGKMTLAEAITMGARLCNKIKGGKDDVFTPYEDGNWYDVYVDFAIENGIIKKGDFDDYTRNASRAEMAYIFYHSVTTPYLSAINSWLVPDVLKTDKYGTEIYGLYNAGILTGGDDKGSFFASNSITRAEAAAILGRTGKIIDRIKK